MDRLSWRIFVFSILFAVFIISPALFSTQFSPYPLMKTGDVIDIFTSLVLIPLYWAIFQIGRDTKSTPSETVVFMILAASWAVGQGMHLSANSIGHLLKGMRDSDVYALTHFYDEILSHYLWHFGMVGLSALLVYRQWRHPFTGENSRVGLVVLGGLVHGLNYFVTIIEAATAPLGVPFAISIVLFTLIWGRKKMKQQPLLTFFFTTCLVATILFASWAIYWGGLPEFSEVGIID